MMLKVFLFKGKGTAPQWWRNFSKAHPDFLAVKEKLKEYNAVFNADFSRERIDGWHTAWVEFNDEKEYTKFMLRWL